MIHDISMALDGLQSLARDIPENLDKFNDWNFIQCIEPSNLDIDQLQSLNQALDTFH